MTTIDRAAVAAIYGAVAPAQPNDPVAAVAQLMATMRTMDEDERMDLIGQAPGVTLQHIDRMAEATYRWLSEHERRTRLRVVAKQHYDDGTGHVLAIPEWLTDHDLAELGQAMHDTGLPEPDKGVCYALCAAEDLCRAIQLIQQGRVSPPVDFSNITQTPQEIADDLRFVNAL